MNLLGLELKLVVETMGHKQESYWSSWQVQVAVIGGVITIALALIQAFQSLRERRREIQWKRAEAASRMLDDLFKENPSKSACIIFDEGFSSYDLGGGKVETLTRDQMLHALSQPDDQAIVSVRCRQCFDHLAYYMMRIAHAQRIGLIDMDHIRQPIGYHVSKLAIYRSVIEPYINDINYGELLPFLGTFDAWNASANSAKTK